MNQPTVKTLLQQATRALNARDFRSLQQACKQILDIDPDQADAWFFLSIAAEAGRQVGHAVQYVDRALGIAPGNVEYLAQKARYHSTLYQYSEAYDAASEAAATGSDRAIVLDTLGVVFTRLGEYDRARALLARAVAAETDNPQFQFNLGSAEQFLGHQALARAAYEKAIALKPDFSRAHWALSELGKNEQTEQHLKRLLDLLKRPAGHAGDDALYLAHAVSREYEKLGDYDQAFSYLQLGKDSVRSRLDYSSGRDEEIFLAMRQAFETEPPRPAATDALSGQSVFVVGMPRSGTTLVERILSAHSSVESLGELQEFPRAVKLASGSTSPVVLDAQVIRRGRAADMGEIGARYARMLARRVPIENRFIDKLPLNFLYVGFILTALPDARVICLRRNPLDTCLSNFRQLFALSFSYYNYHYSLADTARYYVQFQRLMEFWAETFGDRFHQLQYETLVEAPEPSVRRLLHYLGLPWEAGCLDFHARGGAVATASAAQVRQPLYKTSIGRWKRFESHLAPAIEVLEDAGISWV